MATFSMIVAICVGLFAGFRIGYDSAVSRVDSVTIYVERYPAEDLVHGWTYTDETPPQVDYDTLVQLIKTTVFVEEWQRPNDIYLDKRQLDLVVTHHKAGHAEITKLLEQLRALRTSYDKRVNTGRCGYCGAGSLPDIGDTCSHCRFRRGFPTSRPPSRTASYR